MAHPVRPPTHGGEPECATHQSLHPLAGRMTPVSDAGLLILGFSGQALFSARFLVQWIASERARRSVVPRVFWWLSLGGGLTLFIYAIARQDPVFMVGQGAGLAIYLRNLRLSAADRDTDARGLS